MNNTRKMTVYFVDGPTQKTAERECAASLLRFGFIFAGLTGVIQDVVFSGDWKDIVCDALVVNGEDQLPSSPAQLEELHTMLLCCSPGMAGRVNLHVRFHAKNLQARFHAKKRPTPVVTSSVASPRKLVRKGIKFTAYIVRPGAWVEHQVLNEHIKPTWTVSAIDDGEVASLVTVAEELVDLEPRDIA